MRGEKIREFLDFTILNHYSHVCKVSYWILHGDARNAIYDRERERMRMRILDPLVSALPVRFQMTSDDMGKELFKQREESVTRWMEDEREKMIEKEIDREEIRESEDQTEFHRQMAVKMFVCYFQYRVSPTEDIREKIQEICSESEWGKVLHIEQAILEKAKQLGEQEESKMEMEYEE